MQGKRTLRWMSSINDQTKTKIYVISQRSQKIKGEQWFCHVQRRPTDEKSCLFRVYMNFKREGGVRRRRLKKFWEELEMILI